MFSEQDFLRLTSVWKDHAVDSVRIVMGDLEIMYEIDIFNSFIRFHTTDSMETQVGSVGWFDPKFIVFKCLYGLMRETGIRRWEWEVAADFSSPETTAIIEETFAAYGSHLRVKLPIELEEPYILQDLWSHTFVKIFPIIPPIRPTPCHATIIGNAGIATIRSVNEIIVSDFIEALVYVDNMNLW